MHKRIIVETGVVKGEIIDVKGKEEGISFFIVMPFLK